MMNKIKHAEKQKEILNSIQDKYIGVGKRYTLEKFGKLLQNKRTGEAGVSRSTVSRMFADDSEIPISRLLEIGDVLGIDIFKAIMTEIEKTE
jgi:ribose 5-phosphate isomerase